MNIYLDESYNLQRKYGKMFISINGFAVENDKELRKKWRKIRQPYTKFYIRIHATDPRFEPLRKKSMQLLSKQKVIILSVVQFIQSLPHTYFSKKEVAIDILYRELLSHLLLALPLEQHKIVHIIADSRKTKGKQFEKYQFSKDMEKVLADRFPKMRIYFRSVPSQMDILVELSDFTSNTVYKEYQNGTHALLHTYYFDIVKIKNPL